MAPNISEWFEELVRGTVWRAIRDYFNFLMLKSLLRSEKISDAALSGVCNTIQPMLG